MENSKIWRNNGVTGVELLKASFVNFEFKRHWHDELSIGVIEKGAEGLNYKGSKITINENQIVAINPSEIHTGYAASEEGWTYRMFYFDTDYLSAHIGESSSSFSPIIKEPVLDNNQLFNQLRSLHISLEIETFSLSKESLLITALKNLFNAHGVKKSQPLNDSRNMRAMTQVRDYLMDNWSSNVSLSELESITGFSKYKLIRQFQKHYGVPPHQFLILAKVIRAKQFLLSGVSCANTALACGFYDQSHFTRNFKKVVGISPMRYQRCFN